MALAISFMYLCAALLLIPFIGALWLAFSGDRMREVNAQGSASTTVMPAAGHAEDARDHRLARSA